MVKKTHETNRVVSDITRYHTATWFLSESMILYDVLYKGGVSKTKVNHSRPLLSIFIAQ